MKRSLLLVAFGAGAGALLSLHYRKQSKELSERVFWLERARQEIQVREVLLPREQSTSTRKDFGFPPGTQPLFL
jgi:hypothetical protein